MSDRYEIVIDEKDLKQVADNIKRYGENLNPILMRATDWACEKVVEHARANHFFVGTKIGSSSMAAANVFTFTNPDGSPRFKIRTGNLRNSIQSRGATQEMNGIVGNVTAGMEYALNVEEGTPSTRAFPFMRPALEATREPFIKRLVDDIRNFGG